MSTATTDPTDVRILNLLIDDDTKTYEPLTLVELIERANRRLVTVMESAVHVTPLGQHQFRAADGRWFKLTYAVVPEALATPTCETCGDALTPEAAELAPAVDIFCRSCQWHHGGSANQLALTIP